jgi:hypothetical protein
MKPAPHALKYHGIPALITALLLLGLSPGLAGQAPFGMTSPAYLWFTIEKHPGKADWVSCVLGIDGQFKIIDAGAAKAEGKLSAQESRRILEEYEKLCVAAGEQQFQPIVRVRLRGLGAVAVAGNPLCIPPFFNYLGPQGKHLMLEGPQTLPPPELTAFLRILWQKLLSQPIPKPVDPPKKSFFQRLFAHAGPAAIHSGKI